MRTKEKQFRHSTISVIDVKQTPVKVDTNNGVDYFTICKEFNNTTDINKKLELSYLLPEELFCTCRFCGSRIMTQNSKLEFNKISKTILIKIPEVRYRIIDEVKYELSCCSNCLLEHFKDCPPKSEKYYYMKANKYGAYSFGYGYEEYKKICSQTVGITEDAMIRKWGEEEGKKRWKSYCDKQAETNTFEYKQEKYGWSKEQFEEFNKSRAVTIELCIERHGEEAGRKMWNEYCERQRYTTSLEYMIEEYGETNGIEKYNKFNEERLKQAYINFVLNPNNRSDRSFSNVSQDLFNSIKDKLTKLGIYNEIYYETYNHEYLINQSKTQPYFLDFYDKTKNLVIEFNGSYWHADPRLYESTDVFKRNGNTTTAQHIWDKDKKRKGNIIRILNNPIYIEVWESDWNENPDKVMEEILKYYVD